MVSRLRLRQGQEALVWATREGAQAAGVGVVALRREPAPTTWEHHLAVGWAAAFFTVKGRALLGGRELLADERWSEEISWSEHAGYRRSGHRPDLVAEGADGGRLAVEVELTPKSRARVRAVLDMYARSRVVDRVVYVAADELIARHIQRCQQHSLLEADRLVVALLSEVREQALSAPRERFAVPGRVAYEAKFTAEEIQAQQAAERHIAARQREREQQQLEQADRVAAERSQLALSADREEVVEQAAERRRAAEELRLVFGEEPRRRRWGR